MVHIDIHRVTGQRLGELPPTFVPGDEELDEERLEQVVLVVVVGRDR